MIDYIIFQNDTPNKWLGFLLTKRNLTIEDVILKIGREEYIKLKEKGEIRMQCFHGICELLQIEFKEAYRNYLAWFNNISEVNNEKSFVFSKKSYKRLRK
jgi:hypothetical protein